MSTNGNGNKWADAIRNKVVWFAGLGLLGAFTFTYSVKDDLAELRKEQALETQNRLYLERENERRSEERKELIKMFLDAIEKISEENRDALKVLCERQDKRYEDLLRDYIGD